eukprot:jgi/Mesen1/912/ME001169S00143
MAEKNWRYGATLQITAEAANAEKNLKVLVVGGGGREHAICHALKQSPTTSHVFCSPGNAGIGQSGDAKCLPDLDISNSLAVIDFCRREGVQLVVVGPEAPLVAGLVDDLTSEDIAAFGPSSAAAELEGSKTFMKQLCDDYNIPTAKYASFTDPARAKEYIKAQGAPIVVKADGLAAGKGVIIAQTVDEASAAVDSILVGREFGSAGGLIVVEEFLRGEEASFFALVDGAHALPLASAQDHKPVGDGDRGPNTGGMGAYSPAPVVTPEMVQVVMRDIIEPTVRGMAEQGRRFVGVLYAGLMIDPATGQPKLLEYNVRFGDPECQVLMMRLKSDLAQVLLAACKGQLANVQLEWSPKAALAVVLAAKGYPGSYAKGTLIQGIETAEEFINLISSEANEVCSKEDKKTIAPEHVLEALKLLGFGSFVTEVQAAYEQHKSDTLESPRAGGKWQKKGNGMSEEEAIAAQQRMFAEARAKMNSGLLNAEPEPQPPKEENAP